MPRHHLAACLGMVQALVLGLAVALWASTDAAHAAGSVPKQAAAEPAAGIGEDVANLTGEQIHTRVLDSCVAIQAELAESNQDPYAQRCGCYAARIVKDMSAVEFAAFRATGAFNDSARAKAIAAIDLCQVRHWF